MEGGADINVQTSQGQHLIDLAESEEMQQIIRDEQTRHKNKNKNNHGRKRGNGGEQHADAPVAKKGNGVHSNGI